jgi:DNA-binding beta-propeller fold protein YncE
MVAAFAILSLDDSLAIHRRREVIMTPIPALALLFAAAPATLSPLALPGVDGHVGFDDLRFSAELHRVLVPAGRTGRLELVEPGKHQVAEIAGFSASRGSGRGHGEGTTSADAGEGLVFASDRTQRTVVVADPMARRVIARAKLGGGPDYVRWVGPTHEVWVTEPGEKVIETFRVEGSAPPRLTRTGTIEVPDGPESLEIDPGRRRAYTNTWHGETIAIDLESRGIVGRWKNGCKGSRGLAVDVERAFVLVGCDEGEAVLLDAGHGGKVMGRAPTGDGVDIIAYDGRLSHLYVPGGEAADLTVIGVTGAGALDVLGKVETARDAHCVTADDLGDVYVCDPARGRLLTFRDPFPASR